MNHLFDQARRRAADLWLSMWSPTTATMRRWALAAVVANAGITVTGAAVRVTKSGLGCPTWPRCTPESLLPTAHSGISAANMAVEFGNRLLAFLVLAAGLGCLIAAARLAPRRRVLIGLALVQPAGVVAQSVWGGLVVRSALNPVTVSVHFLLSIALLAACVALYVRAGEGDGAPESLVHRDIRILGYALVAAVAVLLVVGVVVTGTGPHSGDEIATRFPFDIQAVVRLHADVVYVVLGLTLALLLTLRVSGAPAHARRAALVLLGVELAQGVVGYVQYFLAVPAVLVGVHVFGATLVWIFTLRAVYALRARPALAVPSAGRERLDPVPA
ncbi:COX15/CtaA family protein [Streptosporangium sandarakinum]|uniref:COX15/CtaA family protein n=1 Tax=Streptosporangium sandarakinum TaxID=1260955 RepID=UPI0036BA1211